MKHNRVIMGFMILAFVAVTSLKGYCADSTKVAMRKSLVYVQAAGKGNRYSINYERIFRTGNKLNYSYSVGVGGEHNGVSLPLSINAFTQGKQHHFEVGLKAVVYVEKHIFYHGKLQEIDIDKQLFITPFVGYRYQKNTSRLFVKAGVGLPIFIDPPQTNVFACTPKVIAPSVQFAMGITL